ncbi:hypothetical protein BST44_22785 [Mycobacterium scrofulaceum]|uniref:Uncharacterized protein n=1 Tax=Mycobacterium scrofulaceum TaxID=1783 RepID=A0A1X0K731_MYCSC|nr:hypothetical protein BST44_22785 [Mycobacterium scrofulaceum]
MSAAVAHRAAAIRHYLAGLSADPVDARRYSLAASRWEALRRAMLRGDTTPGDSDRYHELSSVLRALTRKLGLPAVSVGSGDAIPGLTDARGFLPGDPERIFCDSWREAARDW